MTDQPADIEPGDAHQRLALGAVIVDVREPDEFAAGHVPGSVPMPLDTLPAALTTLPTDRQLIAVCRSGRRSAQAAVHLAGLGFKVVNLAGGLQAWETAGLPVSQTDGHPGRIS